MTDTISTLFRFMADVESGCPAPEALVERIKEHVRDADSPWQARFLKDAERYVSSASEADESSRTTSAREWLRTTLGRVRCYGLPFWRA